MKYNFERERKFEKDKYYKNKTLLLYNKNVLSVT